MRSTNLLPFMVVLAACTSTGTNNGTTNIDMQIDGNFDAETNGNVEISSTDPQLCVTQSGQIFAAWVDGHERKFQDVWLVRSDDGGSTWGAPVRVKQGEGDASRPHMACSGDRVYVVWQDTRDSAVGYTNIYMNYSADAGQTWLKQDRQVDVFDSQGDAISLGPKILFRGANVHVVWFDQQEGAPDIYVNTSYNEGRKWEANPVRLSGPKTGGKLDEGMAGITWSGNPSALMDGSGVVHVVWEDTNFAGGNKSGEGAQDIFYARSKGKGAKSFTDWTRLSKGVGTGKNYSFAPSLGLSEDGHIYVAWMDNRNGKTEDGDVLDVFATYSADGGVTWLSDPVRLDPDETPGAAQSRYPQVAVEGNTAHVVWQDASQGTYGVYYRTLVDGKIVDDASRIDGGTLAGQVNDLRPVIALGEGAIASAWQGRRVNPDVGLNELYYNRSASTESVAWANDDWRLDTVKGGSSQSTNLRIALLNGEILALWQDARQGALSTSKNEINWSIYFSHTELGRAVTTSEFLAASKK